MITDEELIKELVKFAGTPPPSACDEHYVAVSRKAFERVLVLAARWDWAKGILLGDDDPKTDARLLALGRMIAQGLEDTETIIDVAMRQVP